MPVGVPPENLPLVLLVHGGPWARDCWGYQPDVQLLPTTLPSVPTSELPQAASAANNTPISFFCIDLHGNKKSTHCDEEMQFCKSLHWPCTSFALRRL